MTEEFERLIRKLGQAVCSQVESQLAGTKWNRAFLDVRYAKDGTSWLSKVRALNANGESVSVDMNSDIDVCLISLNSSRSSLGTEWFGLLLSVYADRRCQIKVTYDPNCSEDSTFYDT